MYTDIFYVIKLYLGGGLSILHNWQSGMGVPDYPNPNREAPRERTNTGGGRAFPDD